MEFNHDPHNYFHPFGTRFTDVSVFLGGLGFVTLRPDSTGKQTWSGVFLDHVPKHVLSAYVFEYSGGKVRKNKYQLGWVNGPHGKPIRSVGLTLPAAQSQPTGAYSQNNPNDVRDIVQIGDFSSPELHGRAVKLDRSNAVYTSISVSGGTAYTARVADSRDGVPDRYIFKKPNGTRGPERMLGNWLGISNDCDTSGRWTLEVNGNSIDFGFDGGTTYCIVIGNMCDEHDVACRDDIDFKYFYSEFNGIVDETPVDLEWIKEKNVDRNFRVACNFMLATSTIDT